MVVGSDMMDSSLILDGHRPALIPKCFGNPGEYNAKFKPLRVNHSAFFSWPEAFFIAGYGYWLYQGLEKIAELC